MPLDIATEKLISLTAAAKLLPGRPDRSTCWRWASKGIRGIKLETAYAGRSRVTSLQALQRFLDAVTAATESASLATGNQEPRAARPESACEDSNALVDAAKQKLTAAGI